MKPISTLAHGILVKGLPALFLRPAGRGLI
jgi:hypothetical protein